MGEGRAGGVARFVGRNRELHQVEAAHAAATTGKGSVVVVSGEAGIGKTRFCEETTSQAEQAGFRVVAARCWVDGGAPALWPWQPILAELCGDDAVQLLESDGGIDRLDPDRFARFNAIAGRLEEACRTSPVCLFVDDVHGADTGTLLLIRFLARSLPRMSLTLVLGRRTGEAAGASPGTWLIDEIEREATIVPLRPFELWETAEFLSTHGLSDLDDDLMATLHRLTGGNPLFLRRIAALGPPDSGALPTGVRVAIEQAVATLGTATRQVLCTSAVLGVSPSVPEAAAVAEKDTMHVLEAVAEAETAGLVAAAGPDRFTYSHELVRSTLEESLATAERLDAHARAAAALETEGVTAPATALARRAHHALAAAARSSADGHLAVEACEAAAESMVNNFAYEQADSLLSTAVALCEPASLGPPTPRLLVKWAQGALHCGRMTVARARFARAASSAQQRGDAVLLAEAALGLGGHWANEHRTPIERARVLGLQRAALEGLPEDEVALRCRLTARLAAEAVFDGAPLEPLLVALEEARHCGDPVARAEALSLTQHALLYPDHIETRLEMADEQVRVASEAGHGVLALMGLCWRAVALFHAGDPRAIRALEDLRERANTLACLNLLYVVACIDVMLLIRAGRLEEAEEEANRCYQLGEASGEVDILGYYGAHMLAIRWIQGRDGELLDTAKEVASSPTLVKSEFAFEATAAAIAARAGDRDYARGALDGLAGNGLAALPRSSTWLTGIVAIVEGAAELNDAELAREAYDLLLPLRNRPVMASLAMLCVGSTEWALASAAAIFGDLDLAIEHLEVAVTANRVLGNRPLRTIAQAELALMLRRRGREGDRQRVVELLHQAYREALEMGMRRRADEWEAELATLPAPSPAPAPPVAVTADPGPGSGTGADAVEVRRGVIRRHRNGWRVAVDDRQVEVPDLLGIRYLAQLLTRPAQPLSALSLASGGTAPGETSYQELLDDQAREAYLARARQLSAELAEAEAGLDAVRAEAIRNELDALVDAVEAATGIDGRARAFMDDAERARTAVRKAIKRAIDAIDDSDPTIAELLRASITTGTTCTYIPPRHSPVTWSAAVGV